MGLYVPFAPSLLGAVFFSLSFNFLFFYLLCNFVLFKYLSDMPNKVVKKEIRKIRDGFIHFLSKRIRRMHDFYTMGFNDISCMLIGY